MTQGDGSSGALGNGDYNDSPEVGFELHTGKKKIYIHATLLPLAQAGTRDVVI